MTRKKSADTPHKGHRIRLKRQFLQHAPALLPHQILELVLFFTIPRCDTNPSAHALIERFGGLREVLSAPPDELMKVDGIGERTAEFINILAGVSAMLINFCGPEGICADNILSLQAFFYTSFFRGHGEQFLIACLDDRRRIAYSEVFEVSGGQQATAEFATNWLANRYSDRYIVAKYSPQGSFDREAERKNAYLIKSSGVLRALMDRYYLVDDETVTAISFD